MKFKKTEKCDLEVKRAKSVMTSNMSSSISPENQMKIFKIAHEKLGCKGETEYGECAPDFLIFDPTERFFEKEEDDGRSLHIGFPGLESKVYVKLDDYGSRENLSENIGYPVDTRFLKTFMLSEDY